MFATCTVRPPGEEQVTVNSPSAFVVAATASVPRTLNTAGERAVGSSREVQTNPAFSPGVGEPSEMRSRKEHCEVPSSSEQPQSSFSGSGSPHPPSSSSAGDSSTPSSGEVASSVYASSPSGVWSKLGVSVLGG